MSTPPPTLNVDRPALLRDHATHGPLAEQMVQRQLRARQIDDPRVLAAMCTVPRHLFLDPDRRPDAYADRALPTRAGQTISQPYMVAAMTEQLRLTSTDRVLEIGTGSGYQSAVLALLSQHVISIERRTELADGARHVLDTLGFTNVTIHTGDGTLGWPDAAPFDAILVTAGAPEPPAALIDQLADRGRMVIPIGNRDTQSLLTLTRRGDHLDRRFTTDCRFVPLVGQQGWPE